MARREEIARASCRARRPPVNCAALRAVSSAVEHYLDMVGVTSSILVPPTTFPQASGTKTEEKEPRLLFLCPPFLSGRRCRKSSLSGRILITRFVGQCTLHVSPGCAHAFSYPAMENGNDQTQPCINLPYGTAGVRRHRAGAGARRKQLAYDARLDGARRRSL